MKLDEMVQRTNRHVAILGAFNLDPKEPKVLRGRASEILQKLQFSLMSKRVTRWMNGDHAFNTYEVTSPAVLLGEADSKPVDITGWVVLPDGDGVLAEYLAGARKDAEGEIGAKLLAKLLDATDALRPFEHPFFGVQLTEGMYYAWESRGLPPKIVDAYTLREILYHPAFNLALLDYLRADARRDEKGALRLALLEAADKALTEKVRDVTGKSKEDLAQAFVTEATMYRDWLTTPSAVTRAVPKSASADSKQEQKKSAMQHFAVLEERHGRGGEFQAARRAHPIPEHESGELRAVYAIFREASDRVGNLAQCEPLMAFVTQWYLESFSNDKAGAALANAIFDAIYKDNRKARPSKIPQRVRLAAAERHAEPLQALLNNPSSKPQDLMAREMAETAVADYQRVRRPQAGFERTELIKLMRDELLSLSMKLFPGREALEESNLKLVEAFLKADREVDRCFDINAGDKAAEQLKAAMEPVFATLGDEVGAICGEDEGKKAKAILDSVLSQVGASAKPSDLAEALVVALSRAEGVLKAARINDFRKEEGKNIEEAGNAVRDAYEQLLTSVEGLKVAGSLAAVNNPGASAADARNAKVIVEIARLLKSGGGTVEVMPADKKEEEEMGATATATAGAGAPDAPESGVGAGEGDMDKPTLDDSGAGGRDDDVVLGADLDRAPRPVSLQLTAEESIGLLQKASQETLNEGSRGKPAAVRRWAEALVDARERVVEAKGEIVKDPRVVSQKDAVGKQLAAGSRFLTLGEFFLAAPSASTPLGNPDTSFNAMIALYLMRETGRAHGPGARDALKTWKQKDTDPQDQAAKLDAATSDIRKVPLWQICPAIFDTDKLSQEQISVEFRKAASKSIAEFIAKVRAQTAALSQLASFYIDVEEIKKLLSLLKSAGDCEVTVVNTIAPRYGRADVAANYPVGGPLFNGERGAVNDMPPGTVFVSPQAFPPDALKNLDVLTAPIGLPDGEGQEPLRTTNGTSWLRSQTHPGVFGVPVLIGRNVQSSELPVIGFDVRGLPMLVALLTGGPVERLKEFREPWGTFTQESGLPFVIGEDTSVLMGLGKMLETSEVHGPIISSKVLTAVAHQRQFGPLDRRSGMLKNSVDFGPAPTAPSLIHAVDAALFALSALPRHLRGGSGLDTLVFLQSNDGWVTRRNWKDGTGEPKGWIAFAPPPELGANIANTIFTRL